MPSVTAPNSSISCALPRRRRASSLSNSSFCKPSCDTSSVRRRVFQLFDPRYVRAAGSENLMKHFMCVQCAVQFAASDAPPSSCPICSDPRQYIRLAGQAWTTMEELGRDHRVVVKDEDGIMSIGVEPVFGIGQRALLAETPDGNVLWDCVPLVTDEAVRALNARGKVKSIAISHPHFHSAIVEWSRALGDIPIYIHADNREWVMRPDSRI